MKTYTELTDVEYSLIIILHKIGSLPVHILIHRLHRFLLFAQNRLIAHVITRCRFLLFLATETPRLPYSERLLQELPESADQSEHRMLSVQLDRLVHQI